MVTYCCPSTLSGLPLSAGLPTPRNTASVISPAIREATAIDPARMRRRGLHASGRSWRETSDPFADKNSKPADWVTTGPHIMVSAPAAALSSLPDKPSGGAPYVMWKGTPYAHIMVPVKS